MGRSYRGIIAGRNLRGARKRKRRPRGRRHNASDFEFRGTQTRRYFFSSVAGEAGGAGVAAGGLAGGFAAGVFGCGLFIPSLKLRMPSPSPRITSGIFLPPKSSTMIASTINQWIGLNSPISHLPSISSELSRAVRDPRARQSTKYNTLIPHAARDVLAVEMLQ